VVGARFAIERLQGAGAMGEVYRALDRQSGEPVAIKVLLGERVNGEARFEQEARALAELSHPAVVRYVAHGVSAEGEAFLAMEWLEGEDLSIRLGRGPLTVRESVTLAFALAGALAAAHARGIVHRDLKPSNILLVGGDVALATLIDFGIARRSAGTRLTRTGVLLGTPGYMAPEQARGGKVDARADVFSLGCVLHECLTGEPVFAGDHVLAILVKILIEEAPHVDERCPDAPPALGDLVARMLAKDPEERPRDGAEVAAALGARGAELPAASPARLGSGERRAFAIVLLGAPDAPAAAEAATLDEDTAALADDELRRTAKAWGGRFHPLGDGAAVIVFAGAGVAMDLAVQAARAALALRPGVGDRALAIATASAEVTGRWPASAAIDRAASLLARRAAPRAGSSPPPIALDAVTAGLLDARFEVEALFLHSERDLDTGARTLLGKRTRCLGRDPELAALLAGLDACIEEPGARAVLITGEAGVGKSRLRQELVELVRARGDGIEVWMARGDPIRAGAPFGLLAQIVRSAAQLTGGEPLATRREKLRARVKRHVEAPLSGRVTEFLGELVGVRFPAEESVQLRAARQDPKLLGDQTRRAWLDFVQAECRAQAVLLVLEDLHWGDAPTVEYVGTALRLLGDAPLFVLALARPEVRARFPALWGVPGVAEMRLAGLSRKACERLVREALGSAAPAARVAALVARSEGNAFFLEELVRAAVEGRKEAPGTVLAMMQSRLDERSPEARQILRVGSIFGEVFWRGGVEALIGGGAGAATLDRGLAELTEHELCTRAPGAVFPGEVEYAFRHGLLREATYPMLTEVDRSLGHRLAGEWLAKIGEQSALVIAEHFARGGAPSRAAGFYGRAAEQALEGNDLTAAIERATRAAASETPAEELGQLLLIRAEAHFWRGDLGEAEQLARAALEALPEGSDRWYTAVRRAIEAAERLGLRERVLALAAALERACPTEATSPSQGIALALAMGQCASIGAVNRALAFAGKLGGVAARFVDDPRVVGAIESGRGMLAFMTGDLGAHRAHRAAALAAFERAGNVRAACHERCWLAVAHLDLGAAAEARDLLQIALAEAARIDLRFVIGAAKYSLGTALARLGAIDEARAAAAEAIAEFLAQGDERRIASSRASFAAILRQAGALAEAEVEARRGAEMSGSRPWHPYLLATLADVLLSRGRGVEALERARTAAALVALRGDAVGEANVRLVFAEALAANGAVVEARAAIAEARERLLARADGIAEIAARRSFLERVPENARTLELAQAWLDERS
jgi:tetratricopeptide (TPR) repeat protein